MWTRISQIVLGSVAYRRLWALSNLPEKSGDCGKRIAFTRAQVIKTTLSSLPFFRLPLTPTSIIVSFVCRTKWIELNISALLLHLGAILPAVLLPPLALHIRSFISNFMYNVSCFRAFGSLTNCKCTQGLFTELLCLIDSKAYQTAGPVLADGGSEDLS